MSAKPGVKARNGAFSLCDCILIILEEVYIPFFSCSHFLYHLSSKHPFSNTSFKACLCHAALPCSQMCHTLASSTVVCMKPGFDQDPYPPPLLIPPSNMSRDPLECISSCSLRNWAPKLCRRRRRDLGLQPFLATDDFTESQCHRLTFITASLPLHIFWYSPCIVNGDCHVIKSLLITRAYFYAEISIRSLPRRRPDQ